MGSFANTLFLWLLGWIRTAASLLWNIMSGASASVFLQWIEEHWVLTAGAICIIGLVSDWLVYMFRWRPYRVWGSYFRRLQRGKEPETEDTAENSEDSLETDSPLAQDAGAPGFQAMGQEPLKEKNGRASAWNWEEEGTAEQVRFSESASETYRRYRNRPEEEQDPQDTTARFEEAIRPRRRRTRIGNLFREDGSEADYVAPQELIDRREAYRQPVYPRNWKGNTEKDEWNQVE